MISLHEAQKHAISCGFQFQINSSVQNCILPQGIADFMVIYESLKGIKPRLLRITLSHKLLQSELQ